MKVSTVPKQTRESKLEFLDFNDKGGIRNFLEARVLVDAHPELTMASEDRIKKGLNNPKERIHIQKQDWFFIGTILGAGKVGPREKSIVTEYTIFGKPTKLVFPTYYFKGDVRLTVEHEDHTLILNTKQTGTGKEIGEWVKKEGIERFCEMTQEGAFRIMKVLPYKPEYVKVREKIYVEIAAAYVAPGLNCFYGNYGGRYVYLDDAEPSIPFGVAVVQSDVAYKNRMEFLLNTKAKEIVEKGTPAQIEAAVKLLKRIQPGNLEHELLNLFSNLQNAEGFAPNSNNVIKSNTFTS